MSRLTIYRDTAPAAPELRTEDPQAIAECLAPLDVAFERWVSPVETAPGAPPETILDAYRPHLDALMRRAGATAGSADVVRLTPEHPQAQELRAKFLSEHRHTEPEIRYFIEGAGNFILHVADRVYDVHCTAGDLISVPAGIRHWFDAGERPHFVALRIFSDNSGWVPHFTGDPISERFPAA